MQHNPLTRPIAQLLRDTQSAMSEYELLRALDLTNVDLGEDAPAGSELALFRQHFLIMNALYSLQPIFWEEQLLLSISALKIELTAVEPSCIESGLPQQPDDQEIRSYYLDWQEFEQSSNESVAALLDSFWQKYFAQGDLSKALNCLGLDEGCEFDEVKKRYRLLAAEHHPDKGGDAQRFIEIREAYEILACLKAS